MTLLKKSGEKSRVYKKILADARMFLLQIMSYKIFNHKCLILKLNPDMRSWTITMFFNPASDINKYRGGCKGGY